MHCYHALCVSRELDAKLAELRSQKTEYKEGYWNCNTILIGGLGKDPVIEGKQLVPHVTQLTFVLLNDTTRAHWFINYQLLDMYVQIMTAKLLK